MGTEQRRKKKKQKQAYPHGDVPFHEGGPNVPVHRRTVVHVFPLEGDAPGSAPFVAVTSGAIGRYASHAVNGMRITHGDDVESVFVPMRDAALHAINAKSKARIVVPRDALLNALQSLDDGADAVQLELVVLGDEVVQSLDIVQSKRYLRTLETKRHDVALRLASSNGTGARPDRVALVGLPRYTSRSYEDVAKRKRSDEYVEEQSRKRDDSMREALKRARAMLRATHETEGAHAQKKSAKRARSTRSAATAQARSARSASRRRTH